MMSTRTSENSKRFSWGKIIGWIFLVLVIILTLFPFYWILRTALSTNGSLAANSTQLLPVDFSLGGFKRVLGLQDAAEAAAEGGSLADIAFWSALRNSVFVSTFVALCQVIVAAMAAYAFSRLRWPGRNIVYSLFLGGLLIPSIFTTIPNFLTIRELNLFDNVLGIAIPTVFMTLPFAIFFLRQFFAGISNEIEEAALLDGAGRIKTFSTIIIPMALPSVFTLGVLTYIASWNDYMWPLLVSQSESSRTLTLALGVFRAQSPQTAPDWSGLMAATLLAALPTLILFMLFARRIVNSIGFSGIK
jgi:multiple sugar transport system permease protein